MILPSFTLIIPGLVQSVYHIDGALVYTGAPIAHVRWCPVDSLQEKTTLKGVQYAAVIEKADVKLGPVYQCEDSVTIWMASLGYVFT